MSLTGWTTPLSVLICSLPSPARKRIDKRKIEAMNGDRREAVDKIIKIIDSEIGETKPDVIITGDANWSPGVLGLTANRMLENTIVRFFFGAREG